MVEKGVIGRGREGEGVYLWGVGLLDGIENFVGEYCMVVIKVLIRSGFCMSIEAFYFIKIKVCLLIE